jgi:hypothetical protein
MPAKNDDLHGNVPDCADVALLLIDVINDLEFEGSPEDNQYALRHMHDILQADIRPSTEINWETLI